MTSCAYWHWAGPTKRSPRSWNSAYEQSKHTCAASTPSSRSAPHRGGHRRNQGGCCVTPALPSTSTSARGWFARLTRHTCRLHFWVVQALVLILSALHFLLEASEQWTPTPLYLLPISTLFIPLIYAALNFGVEGALPTALLWVALSLPNVFLFHDGAQRIGVLTQLALLLILGVIVAARVDREQRSKEAAERANRGLQDAPRTPCVPTSNSPSVHKRANASDYPANCTTKRSRTWSLFGTAFAAPFNRESRSTSEHSSSRAGSIPASTTSGDCAARHDHPSWTTSASSPPSRHSPAKSGHTRSSTCPWTSRAHRSASQRKPNWPSTGSCKKPSTTWNDMPPQTEPRSKSATTSQAQESPSLMTGEGSIPSRPRKPAVWASSACANEPALSAASSRSPDPMDSPELPCCYPITRAQA